MNETNRPAAVSPSRRRALRRLAVTSYSLVPATGETRLSHRAPGRPEHVSLHPSRREAQAVAFGLGCGPRVEKRPWSGLGKAQRAVLAFFADGDRGWCSADVVGEALTERRGIAAEGWARPKLDKLVERGLIERGLNGAFYRATVAGRDWVELNDLCPGCGLPAHASESDDDGYHEGCR